MKHMLNKNIPDPDDSRQQLFTHKTEYFENIFRNRKPFVNDLVFPYQILNTPDNISDCNKNINSLINISDVNFITKSKNKKGYNTCSRAKILLALDAEMKLKYARSVNNQEYNAFSVYNILSRLNKGKIKGKDKFVSRTTVLKVLNELEQEGIINSALLRPKSKGKIQGKRLYQINDKAFKKHLKHENVKPTQNKAIERNLYSTKYNCTNYKIVKGKGNFYKFKLGLKTLTNEIVKPLEFLQHHLGNIAFTVRQNSQNYVFTNQQIEKMIKPFIAVCIKQPLISSLELIKRFLGWIKQRSQKITDSLQKNDTKLLKRSSMRCKPSEYAFVVENYRSAKIIEDIQKLMLESKKYQEVTNRLMGWGWLPSRDDIYAIIGYVSAKYQKEMSKPNFIHLVANILFNSKLKKGSI